MWCFVVVVIGAAVVATLWFGTDVFNPPRRTEPSVQGCGGPLASDREQKQLDIKMMGLSRHGLIHRCPQVRTSMAALSQSKAEDLVLTVMEGREATVDDDGNLSQGACAFCFDTTAVLLVAALEIRGGRECRLADAWSCQHDRGRGRVAGR